MTKDEALQMCLEYIETNAHERKYVRHAIKQARSAPVQDIDWKDMYEKEKRRSEMWVAKYEKDIGPLEYAVPVAASAQEPVSMRMPKVGDRVVCLEDKSIGTVVSLTAGGSPDIKFDDGSHGTYMLREFAELFGYTEAQPAPVQPVASLNEADVLMLAEAHGIDPSTKGLYGFYIDCISNQPAAQPAVPDALTSADIEEHIEYVAGWNECRQAMLEMMK